MNASRAVASPADFHHSSSVSMEMGSQRLASLPSVLFFNVLLTKIEHVLSTLQEPFGVRVSRQIRLKFRGVAEYSTSYRGMIYAQSAFCN